MARHQLVIGSKPDDVIWIVGSAALQQVKESQPPVLSRSLSGPHRDLEVQNKNIKVALLHCSERVHYRGTPLDSSCTIRTHCRDGLRDLPRLIITILDQQNCSHGAPATLRRTADISSCQEVSEG